MAFPLLTIGNEKYQLNNILLMDLLELAKLNPQHYEHQLTQILSTAVGDIKQVQSMTVHERYAVFLKYLSKTEKHSLDSSINIDDYLVKDLSDFNRKRVTGKNNVSARHLTGVDAEALEIGCEYTDDWILGEMAITIGCDYLPALDTEYSVDYAGNIIHKRIEKLKKLDIDEFNELMDDYLEAKDQLKKLVNISFDDGIVLDKINGGADDAPVRFRPHTALSGHARKLLSIAIKGRSKS